MIAVDHTHSPSHTMVAGWAGEEGGGRGGEGFFLCLYIGVELVVVVSGAEVHFCGGACGGGRRFGDGDADGPHTPAVEKGFILAPAS